MLSLPWLTFGNNETVYESLYPSGASPARIYGLPKIHKFSAANIVSNLKFRPIVSSICTHKYNLAKNLSKMLTPYLSTDACSQNSFTFVKEINKVSF